MNNRDDAHGRKGHRRLDRDNFRRGPSPFQSLSQFRRDLLRLEFHNSTRFPALTSQRRNRRRG
jgi:hypothetical protein